MWWEEWVVDPPVKQGLLPPGVTDYSSSGVREEGDEVRVMPSSQPSKELILLERNRVV